MGFQVSQETLYHTVRLVDSTLATASPRVPTHKWQLVAITAFLVASKLEEYYPPSIE